MKEFLDIKNAFQFTSSSITSTPSLNIYQDMTAANNGAYFYLVGVEKK